MRHIFVLSACLLLIACGDPIADVPRFSTVEVAEDAPTLGAVPSVDVDQPTPAGLFARLWNRSDDVPNDKPLVEPDLPAEEADTSLTAPEKTRTPEENSTGIDITKVEPSEPKTDASHGSLVALEKIAPEENTVAPTKKRGFLAAFTRKNTQPKAKKEAPEATMETTVALVPDDAAPTSPVALVEPEKKRGLFGRKGTSRRASGKATSEIEPGTVLPYGRVARICGLKKRDLGKMVAQYPERRSTHTLYDSAPGNTGPHTFFLTGFADGCARQFTASLAVFGSVGMHEQLRYGLPAEVQPYSNTDKAYESLKSRICRVPRKKPCGAKLTKLENDTVFLSIYERFGGNARWSNLLLHDGELLAQDNKGS